MKILIIGAGVLGSIYAAKLTQAGRDVTLLARGARLEQLREYGVVLESSLDGTQVATLVKLTESLQPDDRYDLALVIMRQNQVDSVLPLLAANPYIKTIAFLMNNAVGAKPFTDVLGEERVLLGFAGAGGLRKEHVVVVSMGKKGFEGATIVGEAKGGISPRLKQVAEVFEGSGLEAQLEEDVDAWLKTHLALVLPLALGLYAANGDVYRAARTRAVLVLIIRAFREGLAALRKLNISITPGKYRWFSLFSEGLLVLFLKRVLASRFAEVSLAGHANAARDEMTYLSRQFYALVQQSGVAHPAWDKLYTYINENISLIPDGQRQL